MNELLSTLSPSRVCLLSIREGRVLLPKPEPAARCRRAGGPRTVRHLHFEIVFLQNGASFRRMDSTSREKIESVKQPYCFEVGEGEVFAFAGLWDARDGRSRIGASTTVSVMGIFLCGYAPTTALCSVDCLLGASATSAMPIATSTADPMSSLRAIRLWSAWKDMTTA